jgi:phage shock protein PspC (stress-responsive transcriptional regulator)
MTEDQHLRVTARAREGRWLGGVCAGLARRWDIGPGGIRLAFVLGSLVFGIGVLAYLAAWLILPGETGDGLTTGQRGIVLLAQVCGAALSLAFLACVGALATLFGFGWAVVALGGVVLVGALAGWPRLGPAWALLPVGALVLPSIALAAGRVQLEPTTAASMVTPATAADLRTEYRSGLGQLTIDLRHTVLPDSGTIGLKVDAGVGRTLIALPHDRCVHVAINSRETFPLLRLGAVLVGRPDVISSTTTVFGDTASRQVGGRPGPTLAVDFRSAGGGLVVRDYPDNVDPDVQPDWPGYPVAVEPRPDTHGLRRKAAKRELRAWQARRAEQQRSKTRIDGLMGGPCAATPGGRAK